MAVKSVFHFLIAWVLIAFSSCSTASRSAVEDIIEAQRRLVPPDSLSKKYRSGIDFTATGNMPVNWSLDIDFDKLISFKLADGSMLQLSPAFEKKEIDASKELYILKSEGRLVSITIYKALCEISNGKKVEVRTDKVLYTGCGNYLYDHRLHDTWILDRINNDPQSAKDFKNGLPYLELDLEKNMVKGTDGCKKFQVSVEVQGNRIKFSPFQNGACGHHIEKIFANMVSGQLVNYYEENGLLVLYLVDDSKLMFKRKTF